MAALALDLGGKRVGLAISRSLLLAEPYLVLEFKNNILENEDSFDDLVTKLRAIIRRENIEFLVIGLPYLASGELSDFAKTLQKIGKQLGILLHLPIYFEDESFTSDKGTSDDEAARKILQSFIDTRR